MNKFQKEIDEALEQLAKDNHCSIEDLEYMVINRENGFCVITKKGFDGLNARKRNKLFGKRRKAKTA
jgi:hypothetical protein